MTDISMAMRDWLLRNSHFIHRYENGTIQDLVRPYSKARSTIIKRLDELDLAPAPGKTAFTKQWRIQRLQNILSDVNKTLDLAALEGVENLSAKVNELAFLKADAIYEEMSGRMDTVGITMNKLPLEQVLHIAERPTLGEILLKDDVSDRLLWGNQQAVQYMRNQLTQGILLGDDMGKISKRLVGAGEALGGEVGKRIQNRATIIARTEVQKVSNAVTKGFYDANQDVIKGVQYVATLDRRTCLQCAPLDGKVYYYSGAVGGVVSGYSESLALEQFGEETGDLAPALPQHPQCRCTYAPVTKSWRELGISAKDAPPGTRSSLTGQIPSTITYGQWLATQPESFQLEVLGPARYKMWKEGSIKFSEMARDGRVATIDELEKLISGKIVKKPLTLEEEYLKSKEELRAFIKEVDPKDKTTIGDWRFFRNTEEDIKKIKAGTATEDILRRTTPERIKAFELHQKEFESYVKWVESLPLEKQLMQRATLFESMIETNFVASPENIKQLIDLSVKATEHVPIRLLADMHRAGLKQLWHSGGGRASFSSTYGRSNLYWTADRNYRTICHEFSHAVDSFNCSTGFGFSSDYGYWKNGKYVTEKEGASYRSWFNKQHSGEKGVYKNGDGNFWKDNWVSNYEGRIYTDFSIGEEWWAVNNERYMMYRRELLDYEIELSRRITRVKAYTDDLAKGVVDPRDISWVKIQVKEEQEKILLMKSTGKKQWALQRSPDWALAKNKYPELTDFIDKFYTRIEPALPRGLAAEAKLSARQIRALESYRPVTKARLNQATANEITLAEAIDGVHIVGRRPFDVFLDNEFIECKTFIDGRGQIRVRPECRAKKAYFEKRYGTRSHTVVFDNRPGMGNKIYYRKGYGDFSPSTMQEVTLDELKAILKKGAKDKFKPIEQIAVPKSKTIQASEEWAKKNIAASVDYSGLNAEVADLVNQRMATGINEFGFKPKYIRVADNIPNAELAAIATEDGGLILNRTFFSTMKDVEKFTELQFKSGYWSTREAGHVLNHEYGHIRWFNSGGTEALAKQKLPKWALDDIKQVGKTDLPNFMSKYGMKNQGEFYAECTAKLMNGERLHPVIDKIYKQLHAGLKKAAKALKK